MNFLRIRNAIAAARCFPREAAADRSEINSLSQVRFAEAAEFLEPAKQSPAGGVRERPLQDWFANAGRLSDNHDAANDCTAGDRRRNHAGATSTLKEFCDVRFETLLPQRSASHLQTNRPYLRKSEKIKLKTMLRMMQVTIGK